MKIAYVTPHENERSLVQSLLPDHELVFIDAAISSEVPDEIKDAEVLSIFVNSKLIEEMIDSMPNLQVIALRSMGYDHVPVAYAQEKGITITYVPRYGAQTVAEHAFSLLLALSRQVYPMYDLLRSEGAVDVAKYEGFDLAGRTIGVIGTGNIGKRVCEIAHGFRMKVLAYDLYPDTDFATPLNVEYVSYKDLLAQSDVISFHVPATADNHHLLDAEALAELKTGAYVINTARGSLIDTVALLQAVKECQVAGAGLDVFEGEEFLKDEAKLLDASTSATLDAFRAFVAEHELLDMPNVIMTPHMAFNTKEAKREITETTATNITSALKGEAQFTVPKA